jgi:hypothetical protein
MHSKWLIVVASIAATGCASVVNETTHEMKVETRTEAGENVSGAECRMANNHGSVNFKSGTTVQVRRSSEDLEIVCRHPDNPDATARAISRVNGGMFGNIIIGGGIGAIIDHNRGTAYTYPTWLQLVFGKSLVFDRNHETEGQPAVAGNPRLQGETTAGGTPPAAAPTAPAAPPSASNRASGPVTLDDLSGLMPPAR